MRRLLAEFEEHISGAVTLFGGNKATITVTSGVDAATFTRTRHVDVRANWLFEQCLSKQINFKYIDTKENVADIFTKCVSTQTFLYLRSKLMSRENKDKKKATLTDANLASWLDEYIVDMQSMRRRSEK